MKQENGGGQYLNLSFSSLTFIFDTSKDGFFLRQQSTKVYQLVFPYATCCPDCHQCAMVQQYGSVHPVSANSGSGCALAISLSPTAWQQFSWLEAGVAPAFCPRHRQCIP